MRMVLKMTKVGVAQEHLSPRQIEAGKNLEKEDMQLSVNLI